MIKMYGIPNCDTVRKARKWLEARKIAYVFCDLRKDGVDPAQLERWVAATGWEVLLNRRGTTFRNLPETSKIDLDESRALALMAAHPATIKRPVVEHRGGLLVGFDEAIWTAAFA